MKHFKIESNCQKGTADDAGMTARRASGQHATTRLALRLAIACALAGSCAVGLFACTSGGSSSGALASSAAATLTANDVAISEDEVTQRVEQFRAETALDNDADWASWMETAGETPESIRAQVIDSLVGDATVRVAVESEGIQLEDGEVDAYVESQKESLGDEGFASMLETSGLTEEDYRRTVEDNLLDQRLMEQVTADVEATEEDSLQYARILNMRYDGVKRSAQIAFEKTDVETAQSVLEQLRDGSLDFAQAAAQYSIDSATSDTGGDMGWDIFNVYPDAYHDALAQLGEGDISDLVYTDDAILIVMCTEVFHSVDDLEAVSQLPEEFEKQVNDYVGMFARDLAYSEFLEGVRSSLSVEVADMPEGLSYDVAGSAD